MKFNALLLVLFLGATSNSADCTWTDRTTYGNSTSGISQEIKSFSSEKLFDNAPVVFDLSNFWGYECASYQIFQNNEKIKVVRFPKDQSICSMGTWAQFELADVNATSGLSLIVKDYVRSNKVGNIVQIQLNCK